MTTTENHSGLTPTPLDEFLLPYLQTLSSPPSIKQLSQYLGRYARSSEIEEAIERLLASGRTQAAGAKITLSAAGAEEVSARFGERLTKEKVFAVIWPALALGLDPKSAAAARLGRNVGNLRGAVLTVLFRLPLDLATVTQNQAFTSLITRALGMKTQTVQVPEELRELSDSVQDLARAEALRALCVRGAILMSRPDKTAASGLTEPSSDNLSEFSKNAQQVANSLSTPPLSRGVAIADVYDNYGAQFPDAGSLESFKDRLLEASRARLLVIASLDRPEALSPDLRERSTIRTPQRDYHLITYGTPSEDE